MKVSFAFTLVFAMMAATFAFAQDEKTETAAAPWFDMENCEICKPMAKHMDLMQNMKWETHLIDNGFVSIAVIPEKAKATMADAKKDMKKQIARAEAGEDIQCCGYCTGLGELLAAGAKKQELETVGGDLFILTSADPEVVAKIHAHAKKTMAEHAKMMKEMGKEHSDHSEHTETTKKSKSGK